MQGPPPAPAAPAWDTGLRAGSRPDWRVSGGETPHPWSPHNRLRAQSVLEPGHCTGKKLFLMFGGTSWDSGSAHGLLSRCWAPPSGAWFHPADTLPLRLLQTKLSRLPQPFHIRDTNPLKLVHSLYHSTREASPGREGQHLGFMMLAGELSVLSGEIYTLCLARVNTEGLRSKIAQAQPPTTCSSTIPFPQQAHT